jgi:hypothetical protein
MPTGGINPLALTIKQKKPGQRACDEKDAKGKLCVGHLKRWYFPPDAEIAREAGPNAAIYRCERCHMLYRAASEDSSTAGQRFQAQSVNILGDTVRSK